MPAYEFLTRKFLLMLWDVCKDHSLESMDIDIRRDIIAQPTFILPAKIKKQLLQHTFLSRFQFQNDDK